MPCHYFHTTHKPPCQSQRRACHQHQAWNTLMKMTCMVHHMTMNQCRAVQSLSANHHQTWMKWSGTFSNVHICQNVWHLKWDYASTIKALVSALNNSEHSCRLICYHPKSIQKFYCMESTFRVLWTKYHSCHRHFEILLTSPVLLILKEKAPTEMREWMRWTHQIGWRRWDLSSDVIHDYYSGRHYICDGHEYY